MSQKSFTQAEVATAVLKTIKDRVSAFEGEMLDLRKRELAKSDEDCSTCNGKGKVYRKAWEQPKAPKGVHPSVAAGTPAQRTITEVKCEACGGSGKKGSEIKKAELCADCGLKTCKCPGVLPGDKKPKDISPDDGDSDGDEGSGGKVKAGKKLAALDKAAMDMSKAAYPAHLRAPLTREPQAAPAPKKISIGAKVDSSGLKNAQGALGKADVPTAKPPGIKAPTASAPMSSPKAPKVGGAPTAPKSPMGKTERSGSPILAKALPRLGGKDDASKQMGQHAAAASSQAAAAPAPAPAPVPKLGAQEQAARHQQFTDFTPKGAFTPAGTGAAAGAMKPGATPPPAGVGHLKAPAVGKPMGTSVASGGHLARFTAALMGKKSQPAPAMKNELCATEDDVKKSAPPGFDDELMDKLNAKFGIVGGNKVAWAAFKKHASKTTEFKKSLGQCALCKGDEHSGPCTK